MANDRPRPPQAKLVEVMSASWLRLSLWLSLSWLAGCLFPPATAPMRSEVVGNATAPERLILLLPGRGDRAETFRKEQFFDMAEDYLAANQSTVMVAADAHMGYYRQRTVIDRLREDIIAQGQDREQVVIGISLGGLGALMLARRFPDEIKEVYLLAPFLGDDKFIARVASSNLDPQEGDGDLEAELIEVWRFLLRDPADRKVKIGVGCGTTDRFRNAVELVESRASGVTVDWQPGGHRWSTWRALWQGWLERQRAFGRPTSSN